MEEQVYPFGMRRKIKMSESIAVYPGSFDPITSGHLDIIERSSKVFDRVVVGVLENPDKNNHLFSVQERICLIKKSIIPYPNVEVDSFQGLLIDFMHKKNSKIIIKGLRTASDFDYEFRMALMNNKLDSGIETLFMMANSKYSYVSSTAVKQVAEYGGCIKELVPNCIINDIINKTRSKKDY